MNSMLRMLSIRMPVHMKLKQLETMIELTARALDCPEPDVSRLSYEEMLEAYSDFTAQQVSRLYDEGIDLEESYERIYEEAYGAGVMLGEYGRLTEGDIFSALSLLYKNVDAVVSGAVPGRITIDRCSSNTAYTSEVCEFLAILDHGLIAGLCGEGYGVSRSELIEGSLTCETSFDVSHGA